VFWFLLRPNWSFRRQVVTRRILLRMTRITPIQAFAFDISDSKRKNFPISSGCWHWVPESFLVLVNRAFQIFGNEMRGLRDKYIYGSLILGTTKLKLSTTSCDEDSTENDKKNQSRHFPYVTRDSRRKEFLVVDTGCQKAFSFWWAGLFKLLVVRRGLKESCVLVFCFCYDEIEPSKSWQEEFD